MASLDEDTMAVCLRSAMQGDPLAYRQFLQNITPVLRGIVRARLAGFDEHTAEDVVQEALLAIHHKRQTWEQDKPVLPWVYAIARYKAIDALRRHGVHDKHASISDMEEELQALDVGPERDMDVASSVAKLDGRVQQVVRAIGIEGATIAETGMQLSMSENAVRVAFHRGLAQLVKLRPQLMGERDLS